MKYLIIIDTDAGFSNRFNKRLEYCKLSNDYKILSLSPNTTLPDYDIVSFTIENFENQFSSYLNETVAVFVDIVVIESGTHIDHTGVEIANSLKEKYPHINIFNITSKVSVDAQWDIFSQATLANTDGVFAKSYLEGPSFNKSRLELIINRPDYQPISNPSPLSHDFSADIAFITALHDDEFENIRNLFKLTGYVEEDNNIYHLGEFKINDESSLKLVAAHQNSTGIVDAAILTTNIIRKYNPKYIVMTGVCGGHPEKSNLGDIVFAESLFLYQKGKETENGFEKEIENSKIDKMLVQKVRQNKNAIIRNIIDADKSRNYDKLQIHIEKMACGLSVINKEGYFEDQLSTVDRKTIAVDMESFAVARACEICNNGNTKAIIAKSIMDKTAGKNDESKPFASYTSAAFVKALLQTVKL